MKIFFAVTSPSINQIKSKYLILETGHQSVIYWQYVEENQFLYEISDEPLVSRRAMALHFQNLLLQDL